MRVTCIRPLQSDKAAFVDHLVGLGLKKERSLSTCLREFFDSISINIRAPVDFTRPYQQSQPCIVTTYKGAQIPI